jgi:predicted proteasome-type protease
MTYCLGILIQGGLVLAADTRTSAGVDHIATVRKLNVFERPGEGVMVLLSAGNLATEHVRPQGARARPSCSRASSRASGTACS